MKTNSKPKAIIKPNVKNGNLPESYIKYTPYIPPKKKDPKAKDYAYIEKR